ncbi:probable calcium-binding protein CML15 [Cucurbita pepo subsp. pepo]|uniref:probable calcium-binding protein CML15 n=1 Tax=Cucurbita pepo subsp. pepo TaxID=3664 RepID=UPI000C9D4B9F|nr:probable calcium-binding protein CML15 [Cucurbita pepo subsp. pepo]
MGNSKSKTYKRVLVPISEEQLLDIFKSHDQDGDGKLSKEELKQAFSYLGSRFSAFRAEEALRTVDDNHDGVVSMDEMNKLIQYTKVDRDDNLND